MSEDKRQEYARNLAQILALTGDKTYQQTFTIENKDDDLIVVIAVRTSKKVGDALKKFSEGIERKAVAGPYGNPCPLCNGTGKIS